MEKMSIFGTVTHDASCVDERGGVKHFGTFLRILRGEKASGIWLRRGSLALSFDSLLVAKAFSPWELFLRQLYRSKRTVFTPCLCVVWEKDHNRHQKHLKYINYQTKKHGGVGLRNLRNCWCEWFWRWQGSEIIWNLAKREGSNHTSSNHSQIAIVRRLVSYTSGSDDVISRQI